MRPKNTAFFGAECLRSAGCRGGEAADGAFVRGGQGDVVDGAERHPALRRLQRGKRVGRKDAEGDAMVGERVVEGEEQSRVRGAGGEDGEFPQAAPARTGLLFQQKLAITNDPGAVFGESDRFPTWFFDWE